MTVLGPDISSLCSFSLLLTFCVPGPDRWLLWQMAPLSALAVVLNALNHDPGTIWKGPWRWNSEELMLCGSGACGHTPDLLKRGMSLAEFTALARCKGVRAQRNEAVRRGGPELFRKHLVEVCGDESSSRQMIVGIGGGEFFPIGGYAAKRDMMLVLDVARHERPARWVSVESMWTKMVSDGKSAGHVVLSAWSSAEGPDVGQLCPAVVCSWSEHKQEQDTCFQVRTSCTRSSKRKAHRGRHVLPRGVARSISVGRSLGIRKQADASVVMASSHRLMQTRRASAHFVEVCPTLSE